MRVPADHIGMLIGKGGETIKDYYNSYNIIITYNNYIMIIIVLLYIDIYIKDYQLTVMNFVMNICN